MNKDNARNGTDENSKIQKLNKLKKYYEKMTNIFCD